MKISFVSIVLTIVMCAAVSYAAEDDVNVALSRYGTTAIASSEYSNEYSAANAIDGRWKSSGSDKWNTIASWDGSKPHWLVIDLNMERKIHRITVRHENVAHGGVRFNTSDYQLQAADTKDGPWKDIIAPVTGNTDDMTVHEFSPRGLRFIRLLVTVGEQESNDWARIFEVEAFSALSTIDAPMAGVTFDHPFKREINGGYEVKASLEVAIQPSLVSGASIEIKSGGKSVAQYKASELTDPKEFWAPVPADNKVGSLEIIYSKGGSDTVINTIDYSSSTAAYFSDGAAYIMSSSHQDIGWMNTPEICARDRDLKVITPALKMLKNNPELCFSVESSLQLIEYLERHPESKQEIIRLTKRGQLEWGATYHQPYESMYPGESLIRQAYLGRKLIKKLLPGCDTRLAWNTDVPGRAMQIPQILAKAGIPYLFMSRHKEGFYKWLSPDGSGVTAYSPGHYYVPGTIFRESIEHGEDGTTITIKYRPFEDAAKKLSAKLETIEDYYSERNFEPHVGLIMTTDFSGPVDMDDLKNKWSSLKKDPESHFTLPNLRYSTGEQFYDAISQGNPDFEVITGERPNVWLYIHGPTHHKAMDACREAGWLLPAAETFATIDATLAGSFKGYPSEDFQTAWRNAIYPDHGWGGKNGHITDRVFREAFEKGRDMGRDILERSQRSISELIKPQIEGRPVTVFNHLSWARTGPVEFDLDMFGVESALFKIVDADGNTVPHQIVRSRDGGFSKDGSLRVLFVAHDVPPVGYASYYAVSTDDAAEAQTETSFAVGSDYMENSRYLIELTSGGLKRIYDKNLGRQLLNTDKFAGGEVFTMSSIGNGAGEFAAVQQPDMDGFDRVGSHNAGWSLIEDGPVRVTFESTQRINHATVVQRISLIDGVDRIDFETELLAFDGTKNREFRMAFPLDMENAEIAYNVPMGVVEVGKNEIGGAAGERYKDICAEVHPREVIDWFSASDGEHGVTVTSSVAVFDWIDPTDDAVDYPVLQPLLLASRKSCHWEGNWFLQTGDHRFNFSLHSHKNDWREGWKAGSSAAQPLTVVVGDGAKSGATLPASMSFATLESDNAYISTIKKCDDDDSVIVRLCEIEGRDTSVSINWFNGMAKAEHTNIIEEEGRSIQHSGKNLTVKIGHHAIETYKLIPGKIR